MRAQRLRTEYLETPLGLGIGTPRVSWTCDGGVTQTAYRIRATRGGVDVWNTGKVLSSRMMHLRYQGAPLHSRDRVEWTVTLWDENNTEGEPVSSWFELGLLGADEWHAQWISGDYSPKRSTRYPVDHFRGEFVTRGEVIRARLYITANGLYQARLNGSRVGQFELAPGSTDYRVRLQYQAYDVKEFLAASNVLELQLADGWYRGSLGAFGPTNVFGRQTALLSQLEISYADGSTQIETSGSGYTWSNDGPVRLADLQDGEIYDARLTPSYEGRVRVVGAGRTPTASDNVIPRKQERFTPTLITTPSGSQVLDFGQNLAGFVGLTVTGSAGQQVKLRLGEILDEHGEFTQANFQEQKPVKEFGHATEILLMTSRSNLVWGELQTTPKQEVTVTLANGVTDYETAFAVFGFRYALLETDATVAPGDFRAIAVYSDMERTGHFDCSNAGVTKFLDNTLWSMKGNFLDVPTDCPTRERLGWTGDAQIFFDTAAYLMDVASFFRKWLRDLRDAQAKSGKVSAVAPYSGFAMLYDSSGGSVGWADALVLVPFRLWKRYNDDDLIREFYPMMRAYGEFMIKNTGHRSRADASKNPHNRFVYEKGVHLGEWLEPEEFRDKVTGRERRPEEATAYLHYTMIHLAEIATYLEKSEDATLFTEYAEGAKRAYNHLFLAEGAIETDRQAKLVRPLALGLVDGEARENLGSRLVQAAEKRDYTIGTGFLSTPFVLPVLAEAGRLDVAYRMLENTKAPSWLAEVEAGATTVWEDWEGSVSHNHYSPGAVCQWLFDTVAGIKVAGENRFEITPQPGGTLTFAEASYVSPYGLVSSRWDRQGTSTTIHVRVPSNTTALLTLPNGESFQLQSGSHQHAYRH